MEIDFKPDMISLDKELTVYDDLALGFSEILQRHDVDHVFVSGYLAILFGRSRISEDIDVLVESIPFEKFITIWESLSDEFYCHNTGNPEDAFTRYLNEGIAIRFSLKGNVIPNVELKQHFSLW